MADKPGTSGGPLRGTTTTLAGDSREVAAVRAAQGRTMRDYVSSLGDVSTVLVVIALLVFFSLTSERFFTPGNAQNILRQMVIVGTLGIGMTMVILIGGIDLSVGSVVLLSGAVAGTLIINYGWNTWLAIVAALLVSMVVGVVNGFMVEKMRINPVIVTLGTLIAVRGAGQAILWINNSWIEVKDPVFDYVAAQRWWFLPVSAAIMFALYIVAAVLLKGTVFGRQIYALGGNERAAALCGLPVTRVKWLVYVLCSLFAGIAGLLTAARTGVVGPTVGLGYEFDAVTAVVLGGASLSGGVGRVEKTLLGALMLVMVLNYMTIRGIQDIWQTAVTGLLILAAVTLDRLVRGRRTG